jgi:hypothetical protein
MQYLPKLLQHLLVRQVPGDRLGISWTPTATHSLDVSYQFKGPADSTEALLIAACARKITTLINEVLRQIAVLFPQIADYPLRHVELRAVDDCFEGAIGANPSVGFI